MAELANSNNFWYAQWVHKPSSKAPKRPSDPLALAKLIGDIATGQVKDDQTPPTADEIKRVMQALGRIGGQKGGRIRANNLSGKRKTEIAKKAAQARWGKKTKRNK